MYNIVRITGAAVAAAVLLVGCGTTAGETTATAVATTPTAAAATAPASATATPAAATAATAGAITATAGATAATAGEATPTAAATAAPATTTEATAAPTGREYPVQPAEVVSAFLTEFGAGANQSLDPQIFLSADLRGQISPSNPLNMLVGVQNMYPAFHVAEVTNVGDLVVVHAVLDYAAQPADRFFTLIQEGGVWKIMGISEKPRAPKPPTAMFNGPVFFVGTDGRTIKQIRAGEPAQDLPGGAFDGEITSLRAAPGNQLMVGVGMHYYWLINGNRTDLGTFAAPPNWSPDDTKLVGQSPSPGGGPGPLVLRDANGNITPLPFVGTADWYPDGENLIVAGQSGDSGSNVFRYAIATGETTQLTNLVSTPEDTWFVRDAHVLPRLQGIIFYGNHTSQVGASGNGQIWWSIPMEGGIEQPFSQGYGNTAWAYQARPGGEHLAYAIGAHVSACLSAGDLFIRDTAPGGDPDRGIHPPMLDVTGAGEAYFLVRGLSWNGDGSQIAFAVQKLSCDDPANGPRYDTPAVYVWNPFDGSAPQKVTDGAYPVWIEG